MFGSGSKTARTIESLIGGQARISGDIEFEGGLRIDGGVNGNVMALPGKASMLIISELSTVKGAVSAAHVIINGTVEGPVTASELLELQPRARVTGDVTYKALEMHNGAVVDGTLRHQADNAGHQAPAAAAGSATKSPEVA